MVNRLLSFEIAESRSSARRPIDNVAIDERMAGSGKCFYGGQFGGDGRCRKLRDFFRSTRVGRSIDL